MFLFFESAESDWTLHVHVAFAGAHCAVSVCRLFPPRYVATDGDDVPRCLLAALLLIHISRCCHAGCG